jgi:hypothetical protein
MASSALSFGRRENGCLVVVGAGTVEAGDPQSTSQVLAEMASGEDAGTVEIDIGAGGRAQLVARVVDPTAAEKCRRRVFRGFAITTLGAGDGTQRVRRIALADSPSGFGAEQVLKISRRPIVTTQNSILCNKAEVRLAVHQARQRRAEEQRFAKTANPPPGGFARPAGIGEHQGTGTTAAGKGKDRAPYGCDVGTDAAMHPVRAALGNPYRESQGLVTLLGSRHA